MAGPANKEIAEVFREIETLMRVVGEEERRALGYGRLARLIETTEESVADLAAAGTLTERRGFGDKTQELVAEILDTGTCGMRDELARRASPGVLEMLHIPGLGPKRVHAIVAELDVRSIEALQAAIADGRLAGLKGFGEKSAAKVREGIDFLNRVRGRARLDEAQTIIDGLGLEGVAVAGALRRGENVVDEIVLVGAGKPETRILREPGAAPAVRLRRVPRAELARALFEETGPAAHVERVLALPGKEGSEAEIYASRGLHYVPPERRHACDGSAPVPPLVERLRGLVHAHTTWSDGALSVEEMAKAARARGFLYLAITDHSRSAAYAHGLAIARLREQASEIGAVEKRAGIRILHGTEVDILPDGTLDYPDEVLADLDFVIASVHSSFGQDEKTMTERILKAVRHPEVDILGHPTGRLLLRRGGYAVDMERVLQAAAEAGCAVELNCDPHRLDLDSSLHERARALGIRVPICPDAHSAEGMDHVRWGLLAARRGGLTPADVPNAGDVDDFLEAS